MFDLIALKCADTFRQNRDCDVFFTLKQYESISTAPVPRFFFVGRSHLIISPEV